MRPPVRPLKLVLDTNVVISAFIWGGVPATFIDLAHSGHVSLFTSQVLLQELERKLASQKLTKVLIQKNLSAQYLVQTYRALCQQINVHLMRLAVCRDPDDDWVLATAMAAKATLIVSGDEDLLVLHPYKDIDILRPADAARKLEESFG